MNTKSTVLRLALSLTVLAGAHCASASETVDTVAKLVQTAADAISKTAESVSSKKEEKKDGSSTTTTTQTATPATTTTTATPATTQTAAPATTITAPVAPATQQSADGYTEFSSPELGFFACHPSTWSKAKPDADTVSFASPEGDAEFNVKSIPTLISGGKFATPGDLANELKRQLAQSCQGYKLVGERDCSYSGVQGREFLAEYKMNSVLFRQWFAILARPDGKSLIQFYFFVTSDSYNKHFPSVQKFLNSFKLLQTEGNRRLRYQPPTLNVGAQTGSASQLRSPDVSNTDVKLIKLQTEALIRSEKGSYASKTLAIQSQIIRSEGSNYIGSACPKCGSREGLSLDNWQWHCPKCGNVVRNVLDTTLSDGRSCRQAVADAEAEARKGIAAAKDSGNRALAAKGFGPLWNSSQEEALDK